MATNPLAPSGTRPLRADARRNRDAILEAARRAFGAQGLDAQIDDIARDAGVGVGTVYRHFPTKDALIDALAIAHFEGLAELASASVARVADGADPWSEFSELIWTCARRLAADAGLSEVVAERQLTVRECAAEQTGLEAETARLIASAVAGGSMRADASVRDVPLMMCGLGKVLSEPSRCMGNSWERYVELMLDGLRAR
jgi:AcrR family transcriptional regulator